MAYINAVWGTCDGYGIIFTQVSSDTWTCDVPADWEDGTYIVEIYAESKTGYTIYTTAILHMFDSKCVSIELMPDGYYVAIRTRDFDVRIVKGGVDFMKPNELCFLNGESRYVEFEVVNTKNEAVVVTDASYVLEHDGEIVDSGTCEVIENKFMQVLISPPDVGTYDLKITYSIVPEVRKIRCKINVY